MQTGRQAQLSLAQLCQLEGLGGRRTAGAPGHCYEQWTQGSRHAVESRAQIRGAHRRLWGEELEGEVVSSWWQGGDLVCDFLHCVKCKGQLRLLKVGEAQELVLFSVLRGERG